MGTIVPGRLRSSSVPGELTLSFDCIPKQYDIHFKEHNLFRLFKVKSSPISISIDHGLIYRLIMLLRDKDAELFGAIDPQSTFLNRLQQDNDSRRNMCYFEEISIKLGEVHASLYKVKIAY